jgi:hypothetical protein
MKKLNQINVALAAMRAYTRVGVPFSMEYLSYNTSTGVTQGVKKVKRAVLRTGLTQEQSDKSDVLVAYTDLDGNKPRQFYAPLILKVNNTKVCDIKS